MLSRAKESEGQMRSSVRAELRALELERGDGGEREEDALDSRAAGSNPAILGPPDGGRLGSVRRVGRASLDGSCAQRRKKRQLMRSTFSSRATASDSQPAGRSECGRRGERGRGRCVSVLALCPSTSCLRTLVHPRVPARPSKGKGEVGARRSMASSKREGTHAWHDGEGARRHDGGGTGAGRSGRERRRTRRGGRQPRGRQRTSWRGRGAG